ncbi:MAG TPA: hypothetical protein VKU40_12625, partial [Thermoanaerobaculia bacterium]|nr:hypothetical protein [Thermoanaerobaculia bacterium]
TSEFGLSTYGCWAHKLGCMHDDDCHGSGTACYCYGASCIAKDESQPIGDPSDPTDWRNSIQGNEDPLGTNVGVNRSCYVDGLFTCGCHYDWVGELDNRYLWLQGVE